MESGSTALAARRPGLVEFVAAKAAVRRRVDVTDSISFYLFY
jgi:hypothetical protein